MTDDREVCPKCCGHGTLLGGSVCPVCHGTKQVVAATIPDGSRTPIQPENPQGDSGKRRPPGEASPDATG